MNNAQSFDAYGNPEQIDVLYSTTTAEPEAFTRLDNFAVKSFYYAHRRREVGLHLRLQPPEYDRLHDQHCLQYRGPLDSRQCPRPGYNLNGQKLNPTQPTHGVYIVRQGRRTSKREGK